MTFNFGLAGFEVWSFPLVLPFVLVLITWTLFWKATALWHSARRGEHTWFVVLLIINTAGILEIVYLFLVAKIKFKNLLSHHSGHTS